jgi:hypothetical protein
MFPFRKKNFKVKLQGRAGLKYTEQDKSLDIFSEMLGGNDYDVVILLSKESAWSDGSPVTDDDKIRIKSNLEAHFKTSRIEWA